VLFNGDLLVLERGQQVARRGESFQIRLSDGRELVVPVPDYRLPELKKVSAGYHSADPLDLVDLFVGSEGTLGLITAVTLRLVARPAAVLTGLVFLDDGRLALLLATALRDAAQRARERDDPRGPDIRSIEWLDEPSLGILRERGATRRLRIDLPGDSRAALLFEIELPQAADGEQVQQVLADYLARRPDQADAPLVRLFRILEDHRALERLELAFPGDEERQRAYNGLREALPVHVGEILAELQRVDPDVQKVGGDLIVPFEELSAMIEFYRRGFERRSLRYAIWGHLSDGNLHPNPLPRSSREVQLAFEAMLEFADEAGRRGGCPLSEHGVGRSPLKQKILRRFLGDSAVECMRRIKRAVDPELRFAPGVLFPA
jgi:D-lactate dehydrogenase (cytochrome)